MSKAIELAKHLEEGSFAPNILQNEHAVRTQSAAELRRLDAENAQLRAELELTNEMNAQLREQNTLVDQACADIEHKLISTENVLDELRAELEAIYSDEPVAWRSKTGHGTYFREAITDDLKNIVFGGNRMWSPLIPLPERKS